MNDGVTHSRDQSPGYGWMIALERLGEARSCFTDDLDIPNNVRTHHFVGVKFRFGRGSRRNDFFDRVENVSKKESIGSQSGNASFIR
jgi:hypothetical protein